MWCAANCRGMGVGRVLRIAALPSFLKTYVDRLTFSFTEYLRTEKDSSTELHQWIRRNYTSFRELELSLLAAKGRKARRQHDYPGNIYAADPV